MTSLSPAYQEIRRLRSTGQRAAAIDMLRTRPPASDADAFEAVVALFVAGDAASALNVCDTFAWKKEWAVQITRALAESLRGAISPRALALARQAASARDAPHDVAAIYLLLAQHTDLAEALAFIERRLQPAPAEEPFLQTILAEVFAAAKNWREAYRAACAVLAADPDDYRALVVLSAVNYEIGNFHEALGNAFRADALRKGTAPAVLQLMRCRNTLGNHYSALAAYDTLHDSSAVTPDIRIQAGKAYEAVGARERALEEYRAALQFDPGSVQALRALCTMLALEGSTDELDALVQAHGDIENDFVCMNFLGLAALNRGALDRAQSLFGKTLALAQESGELAGKLPWPAPEPRVRHDYEQLALLERRGRLDSAGREALAVLKRHCAERIEPDATFAPTGREGDALKNALCRVHHLPEPRFSGPALTANDYNAIEAQYLANRIVTIDDFLSPHALDVLRRFCEEATIWKSNYQRGYVGAVLAEGFSPPVLLAAAHELKQAMPRVIGDRPLVQAWAFKYDQRMQGINMHADFAEVNVNFWITPDEACEDPASGGMVIYDMPVPKSWTFYEYNNEPEKLAAYVKVHSAKAQRVPYRANRCVLFDSSLIHITDELHFKPGYENRRVNVTLLYGAPRNLG